MNYNWPDALCIKEYNMVGFLHKKMWMEHKSSIQTPILKYDVTQIVQFFTCK